MKFKYSVIGDNTQENREWLEKVGCINFDYNFKGTHIISYWSGRYGNNYYQCVTYHELISLRMYESAINCIGNSPLFKAVSAMREDSDLIQWFTDGKNWNLCIRNNYLKWCLENAPFQYSNIHKATLTELQEKFKL